MSFVLVILEKFAPPSGDLRPRTGVNISEIVFSVWALNVNNLVGLTPAAIVLLFVLVPPIHELQVPPAKKVKLTDESTNPVTVTTTLDMPGEYKIYVTATSNWPGSGVCADPGAQPIETKTFCIPDHLFTDQQTARCSQVPVTVHDLSCCCCVFCRCCSSSSFRGLCFLSSWRLKSWSIRQAGLWVSFYNAKYISVAYK